MTACPTFGPRPSLRDLSLRMREARGDRILFADAARATDASITIEEADQHAEEDWASSFRPQWRIGQLTEFSA